MGIGNPGTSVLQQIDFPRSMFEYAGFGKLNIMRLFTVVLFLGPTKGVHSVSFLISYEANGFLDLVS